LAGAGRERTARVTAPPGTTFEYKFTLGSWNREALSSSGTVPPNHRLLLDRDTVIVHEIAGFKRDPRDYIADWRGSGVRGRLVYWTDVPSAFLGPTRHVEIWLPPGYDDAPATRYPVLYMHDGQNLFDPRIANTGVDWGVDEAVVRLAERGIIPPIIFGACGCVSTHFPLSETVAAQVFPGITPAGTPDTTPYVIRDIGSGRRVPRGARYWFDYGTLGLDSAYAPTHGAVRAWLLGQGLVEGRDFVIRRYQGATHNEASWRARIEDPLTFLFGPGPR
jgi:hypothetical protein